MAETIRDVVIRTKIELVKDDPLVKASKSVKRFEQEVQKTNGRLNKTNGEMARLEKETGRTRRQAASLDDALRKVQAAVKKAADAYVRGNQSAGRGLDALIKKERELKDQIERRNKTISQRRVGPGKPGAGGVPGAGNVSSLGTGLAGLGLGAFGAGIEQQVGRAAFRGAVAVGIATLVVDRLNAARLEIQDIPQRKGIFGGSGQVERVTEGILRAFGFGGAIELSRDLSGGRERVSRFRSRPAPGTSEIDFIRQAQRTEFENRGGPILQFQLESAQRRLALEQRVVSDRLEAARLSLRNIQAEKQVVEQRLRAAKIGFGELDVLGQQELVSILRRLRSGGTVTQEEIQRARQFAPDLAEKELQRRAEQSPFFQEFMKQLGLEKQRRELEAKEAQAEINISEMTVKIDDLNNLVSKLQEALDKMFRDIDNTIRDRLAEELKQLEVKLHMAQNQ